MNKSKGPGSCTNRKIWNGHILLFRVPDEFFVGKNDFYTLGKKVNYLGSAFQLREAGRQEKQIVCRVAHVNFLWALKTGEHVPPARYLDGHSMDFA